MYQAPGDIWTIILMLLIITLRKGQYAKSLGCIANVGILIQRKIYLFHFGPQKKVDTRHWACEDAIPSQTNTDIAKSKRTYNSTCSLVNFIVIFFSIGKHCSTSRPFNPKENDEQKSNYKVTVHQQVKKKKFYWSREIDNKRRNKWMSNVIVLQKKSNTKQYRKHYIFIKKPS